MRRAPEVSEEPASLVRRARPADLEQLWPLLEAYYSEWDIWQRDDRETLIRDLAEPSPFGFVIAERNRALVGCVLVRRLALPQSAESKRLFVTPALRGRGIASDLLEHAESLAAVHGIASMYLDTKPEFTAALALYRKRGYVECERYNQNPQATFFFRKRLGSSAD